jgi:hypothetical protein
MNDLSANEKRIAIFDVLERAVVAALQRLLVWRRRTGEAEAAEWPDVYGAKSG